MRLILLGSPGAGKGVIAKLLSQALSLPHISTGDILRRAINEGTPLGRDAKACVESGGLVSDEIMISLVKERLSAVDCERGFILDGFPRTFSQAKALSNMEAASGGVPSTAINLSVPREVAISRLSGRRVCPSCQALYHVENMPPRKEGICDSCGSQIVTREDDRESVVQERLLRYEKEAVPLLEFYKKKALLKIVNSNGKPEKILESILTLIAKNKSSAPEHQSPVRSQNSPSMRGWQTKSDGVVKKNTPSAISGHPSLRGELRIENCAKALLPRRTYSKGTVSER